MDYFKILPTEITLDILARVPTELVLECKSVCKTWNNLVSKNKLFPNMHIHHLLHPFDSAVNSGKLSFLAHTNTNDTDEIATPKFQYFEFNDSYDSVAPIQRITRINVAIPFGDIVFHESCNGLICFTGYPSGRFGGLESVGVCNPITKEYVMLPEIKIKYCFDDINWRNRFGYVSSTNEYKVVRILVDTEFSQVYVYTLGSGNGWRNLGKFNYIISKYHREQGIFTNGVLYWVGPEVGMIFGFDLSEEKFFENPSPPSLPPNYKCWKFSKIGVLDGFLYFAALQYIAGGAVHYDVWLLRKQNDNHDMKEQNEQQSWLWSKEFRITSRNLLALLKSGCVLTYIRNSLNIYDTKASISETLVEFSERFQRVHPHRNTLVSLRGLGEVDTKVMESVKVKGDTKP